MGVQSSPGYSIAIVEVNIDNNENVEVIVYESAPSPDVILNQVGTRPICRLRLNKYPNSIVVNNTEGETFESINF